MQFEKLSFEDLAAALASEAPTPGGGTAAALAGAMGAALAEMVAGLTLSKEKYADAHDVVRPIAGAARRTRAELLRLADKDSESYDRVLAARRLPKQTDEERAERSRSIAAATRHAAEVPMQTAREAARLLDEIPPLAVKGNPNAASDAGAAALLLAAAVEGALLNVAINLDGAGDPAFAEEMRSEASRLSKEAAANRDGVLSLVRARF